MGQRGTGLGGWRGPAGRMLPILILCSILAGSCSGPWENHARVGEGPSLRGLVQGLRRVGKDQSESGKEMHGHVSVEPRSSPGASSKSSRRSMQCRRMVGLTEGSRDRDGDGGAKRSVKVIQGRGSNRMKPKHSAQWELMMEKLLEHSQRTGSTDVGAGSDARYPELRQWVQNVRRRRHTLSESRIRRLNEIGFVWRKHEGALWDDKYRAFVQHVMRFGRSWVVGDEPRAAGLAKWISEQRHKCHKKLISPERTRMLALAGFDFRRQGWVGLPRTRLESGFTPFEGAPGCVDVAEGGFAQAMTAAESCQAMNAVTVMSLPIAGAVQAIRGGGDAMMMDAVALDGMGMGGLATAVEDDDDFDSSFKSGSDDMEGETWDIPWEGAFMLDGAKKERQRHLKKQTHQANAEATDDSDISISAILSCSPVSFRRKFNDLLLYMTLHGHCNVPQKNPDNPQLGTWVMNQRSIHDKNLMRKDREAALNKMGFSWNGMGPSWDERLCELLLYRQNEGHSEVPEYWPGNPHLAHWVQQQRQRFRKKNIAPEKVLLLERSGFKWRINAHDSERSSFDARLQQLVEFKSKHGHLRVPQAGTPEHPKLGRWVWWLRISRRRGMLSEDRVRILDKMNFVWEAHHHEWDLRYMSMVKHRMQHGHVNVWNTGDLDQHLVWWALNQRQEKTRGSLPVLREQLMTSLGFEWWSEARKNKQNNQQNDQKNQQQSRQQQNQQSKQQHTLAQPYNHEQGNLSCHNATAPVTMSRAISDIEMSLDSTPLTNSGNNLDMDSHGVLLVTRRRRSLKPEGRSNWMVAFMELVLYRTRHGCVDMSVSARIANCNGTIVQLRRWTLNQRARGVAGSLSRRQKQMLDMVGFVWSKWDVMLYQLKLYKKAHGHTNVPEWNRLNLSLGRWCMNQRSMARKGLLHNRRRLALQKLGFAFDQPGFGWMCQYLLVLKHVLDQGRPVYCHRKDVGGDPAKNKVYSWLLRQRGKNKSGGLAPFKVGLLAFAGFDLGSRFMSLDSNRSHKSKHDRTSRAHTHTHTRKQSSPTASRSGSRSTGGSRKKSGPSIISVNLISPSSRFHSDPANAVQDNKSRASTASNKLSRVSRTSSPKSREARAARAASPSVNQTRAARAASPSVNQTRAARAASPSVNQTRAARAASPSVKRSNFRQVRDADKSVPRSRGAGGASRARKVAPSRGTKASRGRGWHKHWGQAERRKVRGRDGNAAVQALRGGGGGMQDMIVESGGEKKGGAVPSAVLKEDKIMGSIKAEQSWCPSWMISKVEKRKVFRSGRPIKHSIPGKPASRSIPGKITLRKISSPSREIGLTARKQLQRAPLEGHDSHFWAKVIELILHRQRFGDCDLAEMLHECSPTAALSRWCTSIRYLGRKGRVPSQRIDILNRLNFQWDVLKLKPDRPADTDTLYPLELASKYEPRINDIAQSPTQQLHIWNMQYNRLILFIQKNGHSEVMGKGPVQSVGVWLDQLRRDYKTGFVPGDKMHAIERLGVDWTISRPEWLVRFKQLCRFYLMHGNSISTLEKEGGDESLFLWLRTQRYKYRDGEMGYQRRRLLADLGVVWHVPHVMWSDGLKRLASFKKKHGHCNVPIRFPDDRALAVWVRSLRINRLKLTPDRIQILNACEFVWNVKSFEWWEGVNSLLLFSQHNGHFKIHVANDVTESSQGDARLMTWLSSLKQRLIAKKLTPSQSQWLVSLGLEDVVRSSGVNASVASLHNSIKAIKGGQDRGTSTRQRTQSKKESSNVTRVVGSPVNETKVERRQRGRPRKL